MQVNMYVLCLRYAVRLHILTRVQQFYKRCGWQWRVAVIRTFFDLRWWKNSRLIFSLKSENSNNLSKIRPKTYFKIKLYKSGIIC